MFFTNFKNLCLAMLVLSVCAAAAAQSVPQVMNGKIAGTGFVLTAPSDLVIEPGATPESEHGFYIDLAHRESDIGRVKSRIPISYRYIAFDTKWDAGDMPSLDAVVRDLTQNALDRIPADLVGSGNVVLESNLPTRLAGLPARRLVIKYKNTEKKPAIRQIVAAYNARKDAGAVIYLLVLNTTQENFQNDIEVFGKLLAGFKLAGQ